MLFCFWFWFHLTLWCEAERSHQTRIDLCPSTWQLVQTSYQMWTPPPLFMHIKCTSHVFVVEHEVHFMHLCCYAYLNVNDLDRACSLSNARTLAYAMLHLIPANGLCFEHFLNLRAEPNSCFVFYNAWRTRFKYYSCHS